MTHSGRLTHKVVTRQPWIRRRSGKVCRLLQTDVLTTEPRRQPSYTYISIPSLVQPFNGQKIVRLQNCQLSNYQQITLTFPKTYSTYLFHTFHTLSLQSIVLIFISLDLALLIALLVGFKPFNHSSFNLSAYALHVACAVFYMKLEVVLKAEGYK